MRPGRPAGLAALALLACALPVHAWATSPGGLEPYQMMRSLELVQDRIAGGDQAALPMQRKLLEMVDARIRGMADVEFASGANRRAVLIYAMSGGNPETVAVAMSRIGRDDPDRKLGNGILLYLQGQAEYAQKALGRVDPMAYTPELGAYVALVKGSVLANDEPELAVSTLDLARLLAPGTLVEEAALRRSLSLAATLDDQNRFLRAAEQYVRFYLRSPYASQFADTFVAGVVSLHKTIDLEAVSRIAALMNPEREKTIFLRIARGAAIEGRTELSAFASARAEQNSDDPRALLYSSLASVTSATIDDVSARLAGIDRNRLSENDRKLLDAALAVSAGVAAAPMAAPAVEAATAEPPVEPTHAEPAPAAGTPRQIAIDNAPPADPSIPDADEHVAAPGAADGTDRVAAAHDASTPAEAARPTAASAGAGAALPSQDLAPHAAATPEPAHGTASASRGGAVPVDPAEAMMADTRRRLDDIDKLLGEMPE